MKDNVVANTKIYCSFGTLFHLHFQQNFESDTIKIWNLAGELLNIWTTQKVSFEIDIMFTFLIRDM